jgi:hypothetical protein
MKNLFIISLSLLTLSSVAQVSDNLVELSRSLNIEVSSEGKCQYTRKQLINAKLARTYNTSLRANIANLREIDLLPHWNCIFLKRNLKRDLRHFYMPFEDFEQQIQSEAFAIKSVSGKIRYVGLVPKKYRYDIEVIDGVATAIVKVHFDMKEFTADSNWSKQIMDEKIAGAQRYWNKKTPVNYQFKFSRVDKEEDAFFSVKLKRKNTRGPYDTRWSLVWSEETIAHEFGHMLGLDDEYDQITGSMLTDVNRGLISRSNRAHLPTFRDRYYFGMDKAMKCDQESLMCNSYRGDIRPWHLYSIFKRFYQ